MRSRLAAALCMSAFCAGLSVLPAQASETRSDNFSVVCDGTTRNVVFNATGLGTSVNRFIQGGSVVVSDPRGGLKFLRFQVAGDATKTILGMGFQEVSARTDLTGFIKVATDASGVVPFQLTAACTGGGALKGTATVQFFS